jgi:hypothetical protein
MRSKKNILWILILLELDKTIYTQETKMMENTMRCPDPNTRGGDPA